MTSAPLCAGLSWPSVLGPCDLHAPVRRGLLVTGIVLGAFLTVACHSRPEGLAEPARTESGSRIRWVNPEVVLRFSPERPGSVPNEVAFMALARAADTWNEVLDDCDAPRLLVSRTPLEHANIREDRVNEVLFHEADWCPPAASELEDCYDETKHASTRLYPIRRRGHPSDGQLIEADLEVNGADHRWSRLGGDPGTLSLDAVFVHELGHILGLGHPCAPRGSRELERGEVPTICDDARLARAVMHPNASRLLAGRRAMPLPAEIETLCQTYSGKP